ncbi:hypothetical protein TIFTF001_039837 [Ficus carica]|uniref:Uncharacterized protein n=1 Tax=Ficus carica TaxID=3494 RepID=A0AA87YP74_FICCA|nr:hypothetical protein TIFTF001_039818 [Ficus carica]GMN19520.1 hypothetical protein TIFTF001_039827 [Ficus carica]GMN19533.1 hypothetical protein TIFTF001_039828 [Ficus carica]GMN19551.1 hypothetical protein TIFTF001_039837 [Ficus carica]
MGYSVVISEEMSESASQSPSSNKISSGPPPAPRDLTTLLR